MRIRKNLSACACLFGGVYVYLVLCTSTSAHVRVRVRVPLCVRVCFLCAVCFTCVVCVCVYYALCVCVCVCVCTLSVCVVRALCMCGYVGRLCISPSASRYSLTSFHSVTVGSFVTQLDCRARYHSDPSTWTDNLRCAQGRVISIRSQFPEALIDDARRAADARRVDAHGAGVNGADGGNGTAGGVNEVGGVDDAAGGVNDAAGGADTNGAELRAAVHSVFVQGAMTVMIQDGDVVRQVNVLLGLLRALPNLPYELCPSCNAQLQLQLEKPIFCANCGYTH